MSSYVVYEDSWMLDLSKYDKDKLRQVITSDGALYWNHIGEVRKVPKVVLDDAFRSLEHYEAWTARGKLGITKPLIYIERSEPTCRERASGLPRLQLRPQSKPQQ